jgi:hypothetical protein
MRLLKGDRRGDAGVEALNDTSSTELLSSLATQPGQTTLLTSPGTIEVYVDTNTVMLTPSAPAPGDTLRFYGLVFNDHGTLRLDCARISPGVTELSQ